MIVRWLFTALVVTFMVMESHAQLIFDTDRYAYNFNKCINSANLKKAFFSKRYRVVSLEIGDFAIRGNMLQVDTLQKQIMLQGVLYNKHKPIDSIEVKFISKTNTTCNGEKCMYQVYNGVYSVTNANGLFILVIPKDMRLDGLIFRDIQGRIEETVAWLFSACDEEKEP